MYYSKNIKGKILADGLQYNPRIHRRLLTMRVLFNSAYNIKATKFRVSSFLTMIMKDYNRMWKLRRRSYFADKIVDMYCAELNSAAEKACLVFGIPICSFFKLMKIHGMDWTHITYKAISTTLKNIRNAYKGRLVDRKALEHALWHSREKLARIYKLSGNYFAIQDIAALPDYFRGILPDYLISECNQIVELKEFDEEQIITFFDHRITPDMISCIKSRIGMPDYQASTTSFFD